MGQTNLKKMKRAIAEARRKAGEKPAPPLVGPLPIGVRPKVETLPPQPPQEAKG